MMFGPGRSAATPANGRRTASPARTSDVARPLALEEKEQPGPDGLVVVTARVEDAQRALAWPAAVLEGLFLEEGPRIEAGDLLLGRLPDRPRLREVGRQGAERLGRKETGPVAVVADKEEIHGASLYHTARRARQVH